MWLEETPNSHKWQHKYYKVCVYRSVALAVSDL